MCIFTKYPNKLAAVTFLLYYNLNVFQERHWTSPGVIAALQAAINSSQSDRLKKACNISPRLLDVYFPIALREVNDCTLLNSYCEIDYMSNCLTYAMMAILCKCW